MMTYPQEGPSYSVPLTDVSATVAASRKSVEKAYFEYTHYSPSILVLSDSPAHLMKVNQWLEQKCCQVEGININDTKLASIAKKYFDLMIIDMEAFEAAGPEAQKSLTLLLQQLKNYPELNSLPLIVLTRCEQIRAQIESFMSGPTYCLGRDASTEAILLQIVAQIHYMIYRYI